MSQKKTRTPLKTVDRAQFRDACTRFAAAEVGPRWRAADRDKIFPRDFYVAAARAGLIGITAPEDIGGCDLGAYEEAIAMEELSKVNPNLAVSVLVQNVAGSILHDYGSPEQRGIARDVIAGNCLVAITVTEPEAGNDVQNVKTSARRDGGDWIVDGLKSFITLGTASNTAIQKYVNAKKVPQLFVATGATKWNDTKTYPWTMGWLPSYQSESRIYAKYLAEERPAAKVAVLYQNDDMGKDYLKGLKDGFAGAPSRIIAEESYEVAEPTIDSHVVRLRSLDPDVVVLFTTPKFGAQAIKKLGEMNWKPVTVIANVSASTATVMRPAGNENAQGVISAAYAKDVSDPQWASDPGIDKFKQLLAKYMPEANSADSSALAGYNMAQTMVEVLKRCGDDLTRANVMKQAASLKQFAQDGLLPGVTLTTGPNDFQPIEQLQLMQFKGERWQLFGEVMSGAVSQ